MTDESNETIAAPKQRGTQYHRGLGWIPDLPDARDRKYSVSAPPTDEAPETFPTAFDFSGDLPEETYDQGSLGSCTAQAIAAAFRHLLVASDIKPFDPSRLFIYYNERAIEGTIEIDAGAMIRDGIKVLAKWGACEERLWPHMIERFAQKPSTAAYRNGRRPHHRALQYQRIDRDLQQFRKALFNKHPIVIGFSVYENFMSDTNRWAVPHQAPIPQGRQVGGHAVLVVGYDDETGCFIVRNSWGNEWGDKGHFDLPYSFITDPDLSDDFWIVVKA